MGLVIEQELDKLRELKRQEVNSDGNQRLYAMHEQLWQ
jgi:hypothetical protein